MKLSVHRPALGLVPGVLALALIAQAQSPTSVLMPGTPAPPIELNDSTGRPFNSQSLAGRSTVLLFFTGPGNALLLRQLAELEEKHREHKLQVVAVHYVAETVAPAEARRQIANAIPRPNLGWPILTEGLATARAYGVTGHNAAFYLDDQGIVRGACSFEGIPPGLLELKYLLWSSAEPPLRVGWRTDIANAWDFAIEGTRDQNGNLRPPNLPARPLPPQPAARELRTFFPDREFNLFVIFDSELTDEQVAQLKAVARDSLAAWQPALPQLKFQLTADRAVADTILIYKSPVVDPRDPTGIRTLCAYYRTLAENLPGREPMAQRLQTLARISLDHGDVKLAHGPAAVKKMTVAAIGYALGLAERNDPDSVMRPGADVETQLTAPSSEDVEIVRHLWANVPLKLCQLLLSEKKLDEAQRAAEFITPGSSQATRAQDELQRARM